ncbi:hypothetical protein D3C75_1019200 [compost metagenome]
MIKPLNIVLRKPQNTGIFHDSRGDSEKLREVCNILIDKVNELVNKVNELESKEGE